ncbi:MAG: phosphomannomutase/phosphoglucomutase [Acidimicrobiia bacterium]|nr:phosphomannomutase/phosphoglucomutase [Acidimicrobiia bacterium]
MADLDAIFKAYDIRGTVPDQLDADTSRAIGAAFARFLVDTEGASQVVVAHDMRPTGPEYAEAFAAGVMGQGVDVVRMGLASTDMLYFASGHLGVPGAVFTASHNPAEYNGIKMCRAQAAPIGADSGLAEIKAMTRDGVDAATSTGVASDIELLDAFADHVRSFIDVASLRPLKIVADTANGMGGLVAPAVFEKLPVDVEILYAELDGTFPNHPADPIQPENQADLIARLLEVKADVGLAFDGDADRVFLVDETGRAISGSLTTALVAGRVLAKEPGATVLHNLICSKSVPEVVAEAGGTAVRTKVGHSYIKAEMAATGAAFAGEHSGHYYFRDNWRADSGLIASMFVLEAMSDTGQSLSSLLAPLDRYVASGEINTRVDDTDAVIERVARHYGDRSQDRLDGLTVDAGEWWFNLRASNTEPLLRLNLEAPDQPTCEARVAEVRALFT